MFYKKIPDFFNLLQNQYVSCTFNILKFNDKKGNR